MSTNRVQQLQTLMSKADIWDQQALQKSQNSEMIQMQRKVAQMAPGGRQAIQTVGAEAAAAEGQAQLQQAQTAQTRQEQASQILIEDRELKTQKLLHDRKLSLSTSGRELEGRLQGLSERVKSDILDSNLKFEKDEVGRTLFNERQLMDWAATKAKSREDLRNFEQRITFEMKKRETILKAAHKAILAELEQTHTLKEQALGHKHKEELLIYKREIEAKMERERARRAATASMIVAGGTIAGGALGALAGGPAGAMAGAAIGQGLGGAAAGAAA
jgi:hypothetical protein